MNTLEKNFARRARCSVDKADNDLSRAQLPDSEMKKGRARAAGLKFLRRKRPVLCFYEVRARGAVV
jgi:hypothetical protein